VARTLQCYSKMEVTYLKGLFWWGIHLSVTQNATGSEIEVFKIFLVVMVFLLYTPIYTECADPCVVMKIKICLMFNNAALRLFSVNSR